MRWGEKGSEAFYLVYLELSVFPHLETRVYDRCCVDLKVLRKLLATTSLM